jgi:hypothetical protein
MLEENTAEMRRETGKGIKLPKNLRTDGKEHLDEHKPTGVIEQLSVCVSTRLRDGGCDIGSIGRYAK